MGSSRVKYVILRYEVKGPETISYFFTNNKLFIVVDKVFDQIIPPKYQIQSIPIRIRPTLSIFHLIPSHPSDLQRPKQRYQINMLSLTFLFTSLLLSFAAAQSNTTFNPNSVDLTTKSLLLPFHLHLLDNFITDMESRSMVFRRTEQLPNTLRWTSPPEISILRWRKSSKSLRNYSITIIDTLANTITNRLTLHSPNPLSSPDTFSPPQLIESPIPV